MEGIGRGRGRARGRSQPPAQRAPQAQRTPASHPSSTVSSSLSSGAPIGRSTARSQASVSDVARQMQQLTIPSGGNGNNGDNGNGNGQPIGRGNVRAGRYVDAAPLYTRPTSVQNIKKGKSGQLTKIQTNFFKLSTNAQWILHKHHVDFNPPEDRTYLRKILLRDHARKFGAHLFDGSTLYTIAPICREKTPLGLVSRRESDQQDINITIKKAGTCEAGDYQNVQVFNIILRKCLSSLNLELIRRNYYDPKAKIAINEFRLELWPGYITSIGQYEYDILLHAEINFKVLRKDTAYDLFQECFPRERDRDQKRDIRKEFSSIIIGCVVLTQYNNKTYRIDDVDYTKNPKSTFPKKTREGTVNVSFLEYFNKAYGVKIRDHNQPMLVSRSNARARRAGQDEFILLVPELCVMTGLTDEMRSNYHLMKAQAQHTAVGPSDRAGRIIRFGERLMSEKSAVETLKQWGMNLQPRLVEVDGRVLPQEDIIMANRVQFKTGPDVDWTRNLRTNEMLHTAILKKWLLVYPIRLEKEARMLFTTLQQVGNGMKFQIPTPNRVCLQNDVAAAYIHEIDKSINEHNPQLVVCVVPNNRADRYSAIKKKCILDKPVPSQVVLLKSITAKGSMSIITKIAIQINCKIGGAPWSVSVPLDGLMVVGYDVCHDPKDKRKSYGGMVATLDRSLARYFSTVKHHTAGEELSNNFGLSMKDAVANYQKVNNCLPRKIVVYRDGVGDGNLRYVKEQEVGNIKKILGELYAKNEYPLQLGFVVVSKRINVRLFNGKDNPRPGTIVDDVITYPYRYDFFLVSQSVRQGTVTPTSYNVIEDSTGLPPDHMQRLTYKLTHMYFNWSGTVRVPAPCQYAHKLAFLTAQSVGSDHANLNNFLYFL